jgi:glycosyltransferase involved in cell wall biosynthesis
MEIVPTPILILSDAPTSGTGLGRIVKDLATRIAANLPEFRVATLGYGGPFRRSLPFPQYQMDMKDWVVFNLPEVWEDFAGAEKGIIFSVWDATRMMWFSRPETCLDQRLKKFLENGDFEKWGYFPIDATGPYDKLTAAVRHTIDGYDRVLAYSQFSEDILRRTLWSKPVVAGLTNLPHGIDRNTFVPRDRATARAEFGQRIQARNQMGGFVTIPDGRFMVGIVATNQQRKDWGLGIITVAELKKKHKDICIWGHTDVLERHWSIPALLNDFGLIKEHVITNIDFTDEQMSWCYSACDLTLGIGLGEGFGYPIFESLACGTPCIHGNYGGAPEHMDTNMLVDPTMLRMEGVYNCVRPVYDSTDWVEAAERYIGRRCNFPEHLEWEQLWPRWAEWLRKGIE